MWLKAMQKNILIIDSTLRDGSHAMSHQFTAQNITDYAKGAESAKTKVLMVGHGMGLGASSLQQGKSLLIDKEMLSTAKKELTNTKLGVFLIPGYGTIKNDIEPILPIGIDVLMVASHCTEANITQQHIKYAINNGIKVYSVLMMSHMASAQVLLEQAKLIQDYGSSGILLMDSAGAYLPNDVAIKISTLVKGLKIDVGFHAHNNLGLAISNSLIAVENGATIIDACSRGLGAGAGNCQLEVLVGVLTKLGYKTGLDLYPLMDNSENIIAKLMKKPLEIDYITLMGGITGVTSAFAPHVKKAADRFNVDPRDILIELGKRQVVGGQEDIIIDVATFLKEKNEKINNNIIKIEEQLTLQPTKDAFTLKELTYKNRHKNKKFIIICNGPSIKRYRPLILKLIQKNNYITIGCNYLESLYSPDYHIFVRKNRFEKDIYSLNKKSILLLPSFLGKKIVVENYNGKYEYIETKLIKNLKENPIKNITQQQVYLNVGISAILTAYQMGAKEINVVGMDGFNDENTKEIPYFYDENGKPENKKKSMQKYKNLVSQLDVVTKFLKEKGVTFSIITPTSHNKYYKNLFKKQK